MEIQALFLTGPSHLLSDLRLRDAADAALLKLLAALPARRRSDADHVRQRVYLDSAGWHDMGEAIPFLATLQEAVWQDRRLRLVYQRPNGSTIDRLVDPLGLVAKGSTWYLVAAIAGELRTFRVSRVHDATILDEPCVRPADFDLAGYWAHSTAQFMASLPCYPAIVRVLPAALGQLRSSGRYVRIGQEGPPTAEGRVTVCVEFETEEEACRSVLSLGADIEVVKPPALRERIKDVVERIARLYMPRCTREERANHEPDGRQIGGRCDPDERSSHNTTTTIRPPRRTPATAVAMDSTRPVHSITR